MQYAKSKVSKQVKCTFHEGDNTPSLTFYEDGSYWCYACQAKGWAKDAAIPENKRKPAYVEDISSKVSYIQSLPVRPVRGLGFHVDDSGFYVLWPDLSYYKLRYWDHVDAKSRYKNPSGHTQNILYVKAAKDTALVVEGEINALSLSEAFPEISVICPGAASNFNKEHLQRYWTIYEQYARLLVITDFDQPGVSAAITLSEELRNKGKITTIMAMSGDDANDVLVKYGKEELKRQIQEKLDLLERVSSD